MPKWWTTLKATAGEGAELAADWFPVIIASLIGQLVLVVAYAARALHPEHDDWAEWTQALTDLLSFPVLTVLVTFAAAMTVWWTARAVWAAAHGGGGPLHWDQCGGGE
eukprot:gene5691-66733_t